MIELTQKCERCDGSGQEVSGDGLQSRVCPSCEGLGAKVADDVSTFVHALLRDEEIYYRIRDLVRKLKADLSKS